MRGFKAFFKKELKESIRGSRIIIFPILFVVLGVLNTALAKLIPMLIELLSEELEASGMTVGAMQSDALTAWMQFFENISIGLLTFIFVFSNSFAGEYKSRTLILILTKGLERFKVLFAKALTMLIFWTGGFWLCVGVTYICNILIGWDNSIATGLFSAAVLWWFYGVFIISLLVLFSTVFKSYIGVLLGTFVVDMGLSIVMMIPKVSDYVPSAMLNYADLLTGVQSASDCIEAIIVTAVLTIGAFALSVPLFNKKQL